MNAHFQPLNLLPSFNFFFSLPAFRSVLSTGCYSKCISMLLRCEFIFFYFSIFLSLFVLMASLGFFFVYSSGKKRSHSQLNLFIGLKSGKKISEAFNTRVRQNYYKTLFFLFVRVQSGSLINCTLELNYLRTYVFMNVVCNMFSHILTTEICQIKEIVF